MPTTPGGGLLSAWITDSANAGMSSSEALGAFREAGGSIRTQSWYQEWGQQLQRDALTAGWTTQDLSRLPRDEFVGQWAAGKPGQFAYDMVFPGTDLETGLGIERHYTLITDRLISPNTAIRQAFDEFQAFAGPEHYNQQLGVPRFQGVFEMTGVLA